LLYYVMFCLSRRHGVADCFCLRSIDTFCTAFTGKSFIRIGIPTVDESHHSATSRPTLHPHCSTTCFLYFRPTLGCPIPRNKIAPSRWGYPHPPEKNHPPAHPNHHPKRHNWRTYTELLLLYLCTINWPKLTVSQCVR